MNYVAPTIESTAPKSLTTIATPQVIQNIVVVSKTYLKISIASLKETYRIMTKSKNRGMKRSRQNKTYILIKRKHREF